MEEDSPNLVVKKVMDDTSKESDIGDKINEFRIQRRNSGKRGSRIFRCQSAIITDKERILLMRDNDNLKSSPTPKTGFVKSMCRYFSSDITVDRKKSNTLDRSLSFNNGKISEKDANLESESPILSRAGSFMNRSLSWRGSKKRISSNSDCGPSSITSEQSDTPKRSSPTAQSVRSQDSGFSDSGETCPGDINETYDSLPAAQQKSLEQSPSTHISPSNVSQKHFVTSISIGGIDNNQNLTTFNTTNNNVSKNNSPLNNNTIKSSYMSNTGGNISVRGNLSGLDKSPEPQDSFYADTELSEKSPECAEGNHNSNKRLGPKVGPIVSTPVQTNMKRRPQTMIFLEDTHTPIKRETRTRLKEIKGRRRWSNADNSSQKYNLSYRDNCFDYYMNNNNQSHFSPSPVKSFSTKDLKVSNISFETEEILREVHETEASKIVGNYLNRSENVSSVKSPKTVFLGTSFVSGPNSDTIIEHENTIFGVSTNVETHMADKTHNLPSPVQGNISRQHQDPVYEWWKELFLWTEPECMTYLQSKPILKANIIQDVPKVFPQASYHYSMIKTTLESKRSNFATLSVLKSHFTAMNLVQMNKTIGLVSKQIKDFIYEHNIQTYSDPLSTSIVALNELPGYKSNTSQSKLKCKPADPTGFSEIIKLQEKVLLQVVDRLKLCAQRCQYTPSQPLVEMKKTMCHLEEALNKFIQLIISREVKGVIEILENPMSMSSDVIDAINTIINLGNEHSSQLYTIITKVGTVQSLMGLSISSRSIEIRHLSLRAISSICCTIESIRAFEDCKGLNSITEILVNKDTNIAVKVEAAGVLAQITSPWIMDNHHISGLKEHVTKIVDQLTRLARLKVGDDTFLLVSAALANLTFMESQAVLSMKVHSTAKVLMEIVQESPFTSVFAKDQVVTVLANMASKEDCRCSILDQEGLCFLITLLETNPEQMVTAPEVEAAERVLKKTAIAMSRLCSAPAVCQSLISLHGLSPFIKLCKDASLRNYSDEVLVACLAVIRRVAHHAGDQVFEELGARDLIDHNLVDSFMEYSAKQESYV